MAVSLRCDGLGGLHRRVVLDAQARALVVGALTVSVTAMFRDPELFLALRRQVAALPVEAVRVWHAGCATGEEVWSTAILLCEAGHGLNLRSYATDIDAPALERARAGLLPLDRLREYGENYRRAGGAGQLASWYTVRGPSAVVSERLRRLAVFARHDLTADGPLGTFDLVLCRNVLIYFGAELQARVHRRLADGLRPGGLLVLGRGEVLDDSVRGAYVTPDPRLAIYVRSPQGSRPAPGGVASGA